MNFFRILVVMAADAVAWYVVGVMMTYLTGVWNLSLTHAATIMNIFMGSQVMLPMPVSFLADSFVGHCRMYFISTILSCFGMSLLTISTPPVLSKEIGTTQKGLFYAALPLIALGTAGKLASFRSFLESQDNNLSPDVNLHELGKHIYKLLGAAIIILFSAIGGFAIQYIKSWALRFGISTLYLILATLLLLSGICSYKNGNPPGSPFTTVFRVLVASVSKNSYAIPTNANELYEKDDALKLPHTNRLRCLDKAAIIVPNVSKEEQETNKWKLCTVTEVEVTKISVYMILLWMNFAMCGVVSSIGSTYFVEQGNQMNPYLGKLKLPLPVLLVFHDLAKGLFKFICGKLREMLQAKQLRKYVPPIGMVVAILCSILCCITAAAIEKKRLDVVRSHGLVEKHKEKIPMSMFWLLPQFLFLSALDGISSYSIHRFFTDQVPHSLRNYLDNITLSVTGAGIMGSAVTVYAVNKVSEIGGKPSWFQDTLNKSHLDNYYWVLAVFSSVNLVIYILVAMQFPYKDSELPDQETPEVAPISDDSRCLGCF